ncbi:alpha/beta fold hydrolase [Amycolatopsis magusensis]|uniref:Pimeloyl-ACP methyl ester carboxylesterase n=1 Tax=Amycolatopsis magusensis TaxID=882444 RepID=A0ABS4PQR7_9PSEU|nr:alpha/beta hydrolase [Amycolatopsis magusensis]MBP2181769.1 pimeloyl-ACP methyl ester carboxylesterase [Amycolatopsis magusensis]
MHESPGPEINHRFVQVGGLRVHLAEAGSGPLVVLLHGFPETWYSWRHQLRALAAAGYHAVAPDQRGYGRTDRPEAVEDYTILHTTGDVIQLVHALGGQEAVLAGHDWGGVVAWHAAMIRPDVVRGIVALSTPFQPHADGPHLAGLRAVAGSDYDRYYSVYVQKPGIADEELDADPHATVRRALHGASADGYPWSPIVPQGGRLLDIWPEPERLPDWLTEDDIDTVAADFAKTGFTPALNWFRNFDRNWALTTAWHDSTIRQPALYLTGDRDLAATLPGSEDLIAGRSAAVPDVRKAIVLPGCGHWLQQEQPEEVNQALLDFLRSLT